MEKERAYTDGSVHTEEIRGDSGWQVGNSEMGLGNARGKLSLGFIINQLVVGAVWYYINVVRDKELEIQT